MLIALAAFAAPEGAAQTAPPRSDTLAAEAAAAVTERLRAPGERDGRTPRGALRRALVAPGWGQLYNGQRLKAPVVWGALGSIAGAAVYADVRYLEFRRAYLGTVRAADYPQFQREAARYAAYRPDVLRAERERFRRNRDLLIVGVGLGYALQALDAYVSAHLLDFDVAETLSVTLTPTPDGPRAGLRLSLPAP